MKVTQYTRLNFGYYLSVLVLFLCWTVYVLKGSDFGRRGCDVIIKCIKHRKEVYCFRVLNYLIQIIFKEHDTIIYKHFIENMSGCCKS